MSQSSRTHLTDSKVRVHKDRGCRKRLTRAVR